MVIETFKNCFKCRYYDPGTGRFLSEDPIGFTGGDENIYRYVKNNTLISGDSSGKGPLAVVLCKKTVALETADHVARLTGQKDTTIQGIDEQIASLQSICPMTSEIQANITYLNELKTNVNRDYALAVLATATLGTISDLACNALIAAPGP